MANRPANATAQPTGLRNSLDDLGESADGRRGPPAAVVEIVLSSYADVGITCIKSPLDVNDTARTEDRWR